MGNVSVFEKKKNHIENKIEKVERWKLVRDRKKCVITNEDDNTWKLKCEWTIDFRVIKYIKMCLVSNIDVYIVFKILTF